MIKHSGKASTAFAGLTSTNGAKASDAAATIQFASHGSDVPPAHGNAITIPDPSDHHAQDAYARHDADRFAAHTDLPVDGSNIASNGSNVAIESAHHSSDTTDVATSNASVFNDEGSVSGHISDHLVGSADFLIGGGAANATIEIRSVEPQYALGSGATEFADQTDSHMSLVPDSHGN